MGNYVIVLLLLICLILAWYLYRLRVILADFAEAVTRKSIYLQNTPSKILFHFKIDRLIQVFSDLLEQEKKLHMLEEQMQNQIEGVLGKIQEAVYSIDQNNTIIHSNKAACNTFNQGNPIRGKHMEELIRNPEFLDCAHLAKNGQPQNNREISVNIQNKLHWFEVSGTPMPKSSANPYGSVLFVFHDITRLKDLEIVKNNFVANVSHELRTPITIIKGFTETLIDDNEIMDPKTRVRFLQKIESNSERLNLIVNDLLTLSQIESEPKFIKKTSIELGPLLEGILENYLSQIKPGQTLRLITEESQIHLNADGFKIAQVFQNLLENAIQYSGDDTEILIEAKLAQDRTQIQCAVKDNGKGIPESDLPSIFRRFYRVDKARSRINGGTGLGLSIARGIIELHGGHIYAQNISTGGLGIFFSIPIDLDITQHHGN